MAAVDGKGVTISVTGTHILTVELYNCFNMILPTTIQDIQLYLAEVTQPAYIYTGFSWTSSISWYP